MTHVVAHRDIAVQVFLLINGAITRSRTIQFHVAPDEPGEALKRSPERRVSQSRTIQVDGTVGSVLVGRRAQPERVAEVDGVAIREPIEVEAAGEAEGIFLRKTPDRPCGRTPERRSGAPVLCLAARMSPR